MCRHGRTGATDAEADLALRRDTQVGAWTDCMEVCRGGDLLVLFCSSKSADNPAFYFACGVWLANGTAPATTLRSGRYPIPGNSEMLSTSVVHVHTASVGALLSILPLVGA
jgi:hypothetical protein